MNPTSTLIKMIALVLVTCAFQVRVLGAPDLMGKLKTSKNKPVLVNSNKARPGTTIISGARIQCPDKTGATVDLSALGRLDIAANSDLTLDFTAGEVKVHLRSGYVVLTTNQGIAGTVTTSEGTVFATDSSKQSSVIAKLAGAKGPETGAVIGANQGGSSATVVGITSAAAAVVGGGAAIISSAGGKDLSTDNPRRP